MRADPQTEAGQQALVRGAGGGAALTAGAVSRAINEAVGPEITPLLGADSAAGDGAGGPSSNYEVTPANSEETDDPSAPLLQQQRR
ncbi:MAG: hypothetical protein AAFX99_21985 [Myxococcota bacterium]